MRPSAKHLMQHRFVVRFPSDAKSDLLPLVAAFRERLMMQKIGNMRSASKQQSYFGMGEPIHESSGDNLKSTHLQHWCCF